MRIVFLGTPDFSVPSLDALRTSGHEVVAVVTAPDKPAGRGMKLQSSAVKRYAIEHGIPVLQPVKLKDPDFIEQLASFKADLQVVIAFRMLPEVVWNMPRYGTLNLHASLLPDYRGAAPINWAIINGEKETGVSTFLLKHAIDTGDIIMRKTVPIAPETTAGELHDALMHIGAKVVLESVNAIASGDYTTTPQGDGSSKIAPKIFTQDCLIDWNQPAQKIHDHIRGLSPFPGAMTTVNGSLIKVYRSAYSIEPSDLPVGAWISDKRTLKVKAVDGFVHILEIQVEGKKRMFVEEFLKGNKISF